MQLNCRTSRLEEKRMKYLAVKGSTTHRCSDAKVPPVARVLPAVTILLALGATVVTPFGLSGAVWAETHDDGNHKSGGGRGSGGSHDEGHDEAEHDDHEGGRGSGRGGSGGGHDDGKSTDHGGVGAKGNDSRGAGAEGERGGQGRGAGAAAAGAGRPAWAQEGITEVELGRLNVARSPGRVLDRAYAEALSSFTNDVAAFYQLDLPSMERELSRNWDGVHIIDSPLQNLALMRDALDGTSSLRSIGITTNNDTLLAAFLGTASDKTIPVTGDTALAVSAILGQPLSPSAAAKLAEDAERIRQAILEGHG
jgi:hypothetical protein